MYAIKAEVGDSNASGWIFNAQKTMYGGRRISSGDRVFVFASENEGGSGLIVSGIVSSAEPVPKRQDRLRQTPCVSITVKRTDPAKRRLGRSELKAFCEWGDGRPETELNFKLYRQATSKIVGLSERAVAFLLGFF